MDNKKIYTEFCNSRQDLSIFQQPWWLDAACGEKNWDVVISREENTITGFFPYYKKKRFFFHHIVMPQLTASLGPVIADIPANYYKRLSKEKTVLTQLVSLLPSTSHLQIKLPYTYTNWQPFYWLGFSETTHYTYIINNLTDINAVYENLTSGTRKNIRKAEKLVRVEESDRIEDIYELNQMTFNRQSRNISYSLEYLKKLDVACKANNCRKILVAKDHENRIHASLYLVWNNYSAYYLIGGGNPDLRNSEAMTLLMWEAIKYASTVSTRFDFEGSMLEPIEKFFRGFGAVQTPYHVIFKTSPVMSLVLTVLRVIKR